MEENKERIEYLDIAKGIAILAVIAGHIFANGTWKWKIIYSFHMPLFIIASGIVFSNKHSLKENLVKWVKSLWVPYIITLIISDLFLICLKGNQELNMLSIMKQILVGSSFAYGKYVNIPMVNVLWYIPYIFATKLIFYLIDKFSKEDEILKLALCLLLTVIGLFLRNVNNLFYNFFFWSFDIVLLCMMFYYVGYALRKFNILDKVLDNYKIMICVFLTWYFAIRIGSLELSARSYNVNTFVLGITGTLAVLFISKKLQIVKLISKILKWYGKNTLYILCFHYFETLLFNYELFGITKETSIGKIELIMAKIIAVTVMTLICNFIIKFLKNIRKVGSK